MIMVNVADESARDRMIVRTKACVNLSMVYDEPFLLEVANKLFGIDSTKLLSVLEYDENGHGQNKVLGIRSETILFNHFLLKDVHV